MMVPYSNYYSPYDYGFDSAVSQSDLAPLIILYVIIFGLIFIGWLVSYLFRGFGLYGIAKRAGHALPWLSFIPFARTYLQGELAGKIKLGKKEMKRPGLWLILVPLIADIAFTIVFVVSVIAFVFSAIALDGLGAVPGAAFQTGLVAFVLVIIVLAVIVQAVTYVLTGLVNFNIHKRFVSDNVALIHMLLGIFVPLYQSIYFFILRNRPYIGAKAPVSVTWQTQSISPTPVDTEDTPIDTSDDIDF